MLSLVDLAGNPNVGVYVRATERNVFGSSDIAPKTRSAIQEALDAPAVFLTVGGSHVVGSLLAANRNGMVVADLLIADEAKRLAGTGLRVERLGELLNAAGNNILCTDRGALVNPEYSDEALERIAGALGVRSERGTLGGLGNVGMAGVATSRGVLVHPKATPAEQEQARRVLGADVMVGTINHGTPLIGAGLVANSRGALIGSSSTGVEINRVEDALGFLEPRAEPQAPTS